MDLGDTRNLFHAIRMILDSLKKNAYTEFNNSGERIQSMRRGSVRFDIGALFDSRLFEDRGFQERVDESSTGISHGQSSRASTILGFHNLVATKLDALDQSITLSISKSETRLLTTS
jgi:hypothetical protein